MSRKLNDKDQTADNARMYGMGRGLMGNPEGDKDIEKELGSPAKKTPGLMTATPAGGEGPVADIEKLINSRPRADDAPGAIIPYTRRDEALLDIIGRYGKSLAEAPTPVLDLCSSLLLDVTDKRRFESLRNSIESLGIKNMPTWEYAESQRRAISEYVVGNLNLPTQPGHSSGKRIDKGFTFYVPKPPSLARRRAGKHNAKAVGGKSGSMHSRMARARHVLDTVKKSSRDEAGRKNGERLLGSRRPTFQAAEGKYQNLSNSRIVLSEGYPALDNGFPWFHGVASRDIVGGVPCIRVEEGHVICSGVLPRPKFVEGYRVWDCDKPLAALSMELAFSRLTEGMKSIRTWVKKSDKALVVGIPTEGVIIRKTGDVLEFMTFDSRSGIQDLQEWMIWKYPQEEVQEVISEAVTYSYVRAGASDLILDRVIRKLNRLNVLDVFEDAIFDTGNEALYVLLHPQLEETEVQEIAQGLQSESPDIQILGGPLDEDVDWWVLYLPKEGMDFGPRLDRVFEPRISRPLDMGTPDIIGQAIQRVASRV
jgi:hypothetical protein